jgi:hypothetical protein
VDETARRHDACPDEETQDGSIAYARFPPAPPTRHRAGWLKPSASLHGLAAVRNLLTPAPRRWGLMATPHDASTSPGCHRLPTSSEPDDTWRGGSRVHARARGNAARSALPRPPPPRRRAAPTASARGRRLTLSAAPAPRAPPDARNVHEHSARAVTGCLPRPGPHHSQRKTWAGLRIDQLARISPRLARTFPRFTLVKRLLRRLPLEHNLERIRR